MPADELSQDDVAGRTVAAAKAGPSIAVLEQPVQTITGEVGQLVEVILHGPVKVGGETAAWREWVTSERPCPAPPRTRTE